MNTYLGQKGYTILKNELTTEKLLKLKNDLTIQPFTLGAPTIDNKIYFAYRESPNKIYIPHHYGNKHFGNPKQYKITEGVDINLEFNGKLRENQEVVVNTYINHVNRTNYGGGLLELPCAYGKCLGKDTKILMFNGDIKNVQDIIIGDKIMGDDSTPRIVKSLARGTEQMYKIMNDVEEFYTCNESHILSLKCMCDNIYINNITYNKYDIVDISVKDYLQLPEKILGSLKGYKVPILFDEKPLAIHPYILGKLILEQGYIPHDYLSNSIENRQQLMNGIIETIGENIEINNSILLKLNKTILANDICYLSRSLGYKTYITTDMIRQYKCHITIFIPDENTDCQSILTSKLNIVKLAVDNYYGFEIDGNRRFVLGDFTVTHNTVLSLNIISQLKKKTFIIVHKEFLMNQWIERINQFLPNAKIGKIQGQIIDIENKDIVIGMLQSISMKDYPASIFSDFGLTIIDEVHHISSEVFSNALFKLVTKYMLGLSATMNRKDGTSNVFKMFLGDVIFKGKRDEERNVIVRAVEYKVDDDDFNEVKYDYRGNPQYSSMISKLCEYNRRSEFILTIISDMLIENSNQQIMILAHNKNLLTYLHDAIIHRKIASAGYYVGGMKEHALKETETKQIVIATYSMAAEALDIKTLTTLIMATPKTDIEQSVGRILREKHSNPIVVDIIDSHQLFKNQWTKRKTFYKKENYKIIYTNSNKYTSDTLKWSVLFNPFDKNCNKSNKYICNSESDTEETNTTKINDSVCYLLNK